MHSKDAVLEVGRHLVLLRVRGDDEGPQERSVGPLHAVELLALLLLLVPALALNREDAVLDGDLDVLDLDFRELGLDEEFLLVLLDLYGGRPIGDGQRLLAAVAPG